MNYTDPALLTMESDSLKKIRLDRMLVEGIVKGSIDPDELAKFIAEEDFKDLRTRDLYFDQLLDGCFKSYQVWSNGVIDSCAVSRVRNTLSKAAQGGDCLSWSISQGALEFVAGNDKEACNFYYEASVQKTSYLDHVSWGALTVAPPSKVATFASGPLIPRWLGEVTYINDPESGTSPLYIVPCDPVYFTAFFSRIVSSAGENGVKNIHFHIYNPNNYFFSQVDTSVGLAKDAGVSISFSHEDVTVRDFRGAAVCVRFIRIHEFLNKFDRPLIFIDADVQFCGSFHDEIANFGEWDYGIKRFASYPSFHPWRKISGNLVAISPTRYGRIFSEIVARYLTTMFDSNGIRNWWADQGALHASHEFITRNANPKWISLSPIAARTLTVQNRKTDNLNEARNKIDNSSKS